MASVPRIPVTVLGATGVVGQRFVARLVAHPYFEIAHLCASGGNAGKRYAEACAWRVPPLYCAEPWAGLGDQRVDESTPAAASSPVVFSALDAGAAREIEPAFARAGARVFSNASAFRMEPDVPLVVPEVNPDHVELLPAQSERRNWPGAILCNPNCTTTVLVMALAPLHEAFGVEAVLMTSLQALSGAGHPGVASLDALDNVVPFIAGEEQKLESETQKILGRVRGAHIEPDALALSAHCTRVPVQDGHMLTVSVRLAGAPSVGAVREVLEAWRPEPVRAGWPSAPAVALHVHAGDDRPQHRRDVDRDRGMSVHVGRLRPCPLLGIKFTALGHNTERGAAGGSLLLAELAHARGLL